MDYQKISEQMPDITFNDITIADDVSRQASSTMNIEKLIKEFEKASEQDKLVQKRRFVIQTILSLAALIAGLIAAVAALIPLI